MLIATAATQTVLVLASTPAFGSTACPGDDVVPTASNAAQAAGALVCDVNTLRAKHGLRPLRWDWHMWGVAQLLASDLAATRTFSHIDSRGHGTAWRAELAGYLGDNEGAVFLENIGWGADFRSMPLAMALAWMDSEHHRANMLDAETTDIAVGMAVGGVGDDETGMFYVVEFGSRGSLLAAEAVAPVVKPQRAKRAARTRRCRSSRATHRPVCHRRHSRRRR
jgi:uncharacterized protein YkwD